MFITTDGTRIIGHHNGDLAVDLFGTPYYGLQRIEVPEKASIYPGEPLAYYNRETWERASNADLIHAGLMDMPEGYVIKNGSVEKMTREERIVAGLDDPEPGTRVQDGKIVPMTPDERYTAGLITEEQFQEYKLQQALAELNGRLAALSTEEAKAMAEVDPDYAAERKTKIAALLAVKQQPGWPVTVVWPE
jgi:hypothetical protein